MKLLNKSFTRDGEGSVKLVPEEGVLRLCAYRLSLSVQRRMEVQAPSCDTGIATTGCAQASCELSCLNAVFRFLVSCMSVTAVLDYDVVCTVLWPVMFHRRTKHTDRFDNTYMLVHSSCITFTSVVVA